MNKSLEMASYNTGNDPLSFLNDNSQAILYYTFIRLNEVPLLFVYIIILNFDLNHSFRQEVRRV